jgi:hypothetical protein
MLLAAAESCANPSERLPQCLGLAPDDVWERVDANAAAVTRRRIFAEVAATDQLVAGCHPEFRSMMRRVPDGSAPSQCGAGYCSAR